MLQSEHELVITRDGRPVAKLVRLVARPARQKRFDPREHARWQREVNGGEVVQWVEELLGRERAERPLH